MMQSNTKEQIEFFGTLADGDHGKIRSFALKNPGILDSFDYRNFGATPLTWACFSNRRDLVELLVELGADHLDKNDKTTGTVGLNDKKKAGYDPMCSKGPGAKTYHVTLYALSTE
jgi:hypothetical protein